jgi:hypothetical protein
MLNKILLASLLFASQAYADISINLVVAKGPNGLTNAEIDDLFNAANLQFMMQMGEPLIIKKYRVINNPFPKEQKNLSKRLRLLRLWDAWFDRRRVGADINFAITPPFEDGGKYWLAGFSESVCKRGADGYSTAEMVNDEGTPRFNHSLVAFMHEIGHIVGAPHEDSNTIMHADALARTDSMSKIRYSNQTIRRMKQCIKDW